MDSWRFIRNMAVIYKSFHKGGRHLPIWRIRQSPLPPARKSPLIPRGQLSMCPQRAPSLLTLTSSRRFTPVAYLQSKVRNVSESYTQACYLAAECYREILETIILKFHIRPPPISTPDYSWQKRCRSTTTRKLKLG